MRPQGYLVLKKHSGYSKGDTRIMHPNLAKKLAERGLVSLKDKDIKKQPTPPEPASASVDNKGNVETTEAKGEKPKSEKPKSGKKGILGKAVDKLTGKGEGEEQPKPDENKDGEPEKKDDNIADDIKEALDNKE